VADSAVNVASLLTGLETLATAGKLAAITLTGSGLQTLTIMAAALTADAAALAAITSNYGLKVTSVTAASAAAVAGQAHVVAVSVSDSAADVLANLAGLEGVAAAGKLASIAILTIGSTIP